MKLFKFRSLQNFEFALDIILNQRLFCSPYNDLNDPFEGLFSAQIHLSPEQRIRFSNFMVVPPETMITRRSVDDLALGKLKEKRVCSLSSDLGDVRLWSHYAQSHKGIAIEIDFDGFENDAVQVIYSEELKQFGYTLLSEPSEIEVLSHKTKHWDYESEYRIITDQCYYPIEGRITGVYCGIRMSAETRSLLRRAIPDEISVTPTRLCGYSVKIRPVRSETNGDA